MAKKSDLPFGSGVLPSQIVLQEVLELAKEHGGNWNAFEIAVMNRYFASYDTTEYNRRKLANNTKLGMIAYGMIDRDANLHGWGVVYQIRADNAAIYETLGRHPFLNRHGATFVQCRSSGHAGSRGGSEPGSLRQWLENVGLHVPRGGKHPSIMRLWLEKAGVFTSRMRVDHARVRHLMGMTPRTRVAGGPDSEQRAYLRTLMNMGGSGLYQSNEVEKLATATYGIQFNEKNLPKSVLYPLQNKGYIELERGTKAAGRGAKPFMVKPTDKLQAEIVVPLLEHVESCRRRASATPEKAPERDSRRDEIRRPAHRRVGIGSSRVQADAADRPGVCRDQASWGGHRRGGGGRHLRVSPARLLALAGAV